MKLTDYLNTPDSCIEVVCFYLYRNFKECEVEDQIPINERMLIGLESIVTAYANPKNSAMTCILLANEMEIVSTQQYDDVIDLIIKAQDKIEGKRQARKILTGFKPM